VGVKDIEETVRETPEEEEGSDQDESPNCESVMCGDCGLMLLTVFSLDETGLERVTAGTAGSDCTTCHFVRGEMGKVGRG